MPARDPPKPPVLGSNSERRAALVRPAVAARGAAPLAAGAAAPPHPLWGRLPAGARAARLALAPAAALPSAADPQLSPSPHGVSMRRRSSSTCTRMRLGGSGWRVGRVVSTPSHVVVWGSCQAPHTLPVRGPASWRPLLWPCGGNPFPRLRPSSATGPSDRACVRAAPALPRRGVPRRRPRCWQRWRHRRQHRHRLLGCALLRPHAVLPGCSARWPGRAVRAGHGRAAARARRLSAGRAHSAARAN